jgi:hypothetical protein
LPKGDDAGCTARGTPEIRVFDGARVLKSKRKILMASLLRSGACFASECSATCGETII